MVPSQLLILAFLGALMVYAFRSRNATPVRVVILVFLVGGMVFALMPDLTTRFANLVGIGRGTDLLLYLLVIFSLYHFVYSLAEQNRLLKMVTQAAREITILKAQVGGQAASPDSSPAEAEAVVPGGRAEG
jgi:small membrane protein